MGTIPDTGFLRDVQPAVSVPVNPTELTVKALPRYLESNPPAKGVLLAATRVLKVAAESTREELRAMYRRIDTPCHPVVVGKSRAERRIVFVHLGVNVCVNHFQLEIQGKNEATFSCPDELGWKPIKRPIDPNNSDLAASCQTSLELDPLIVDMRKKGFKVDVSTNAGRFVCNWVYYNSLMLAEAKSAAALFVHVPPASVVPVERQVQFVAALLDSISSMS